MCYAGAMSLQFRASRDVLLQVADIEQAARFYERSFGFTRFRTTEQIVGLETGAFRLFLDRAKPLGPVFDFLVDDVPAGRDHLEQAGCTLLAWDESVPRCYLRDPFGLIFNVGKRRGA